MRYNYTVVRFVPDPGTGEFVNVACIAGSDAAGDWELRQVENLKRARALAGSDASGSLAAIHSFLDEVGRRVDALNDASEDAGAIDDEVVASGEEWLVDLVQRSRNVVQLAPVAPVVADSASEAVDLLFPRLLVDPATERIRYSRRTRAQSALRSAYVASNLKRDEQWFEKVRLTAGPYSERLDFAVANGTVVQLAHAWSFEVPDQQALSERIKSWAWTMRALKDGGGRLRSLSGHERRVPTNVEVDVVYVPPSADQKDASAFDNALGVFEELSIEARTLDEADEVAVAAADLLTAQH